MTTAVYPRTSELDMLDDAIREGVTAGESEEFLNRLRTLRNQYATRRDQISSTIPTEPQLPTGGDGTGHSSRTYGPTEPMRRYFAFLLDTRVADPVERNRIRTDVGDHKAKMSHMIDVLSKLPEIKRPRTTPATVKRAEPARPHVYAVPDCRYGVLHDDGVTRFYRVSTGRKNSRYPGVQFLKQFASETLYPVRGARRDEVMKLIMKDLRGAAKLYADEYKHCARCTIGLTDEVSRARGLGPDCVKHF